MLHIHHSNRLEALRDTLLAPRFDETGRLVELVAQYRAQRDEEIVDHGHALAMSAACEALSPAAAILSQWGGLAAIERLRRLDDALSGGDVDEDDEDAADAALAGYAGHLAALHAAILAAPRRLLVVAEAERHAELAEAVRIREALRSLLAGSNEEGSAAELRHHLERAAPVLTVTDVGQIEVSLRPSATVGQALTQLLAVAFRAQVGGQWSRLKICRNPDCQWAFYDAARNRKGTWCSMSECGNRLNNRTYRQRVRSST